MDGAHKSHAALVGSRSAEVFALVNGRATAGQCMREGRAAVVPERSKQRIGVNLVARRAQTAPTCPAAQVVAKRRDRAIEVHSVNAEAQDAAADVDGPGAVVDAALPTGSVQGAVDNVNGPVVLDRPTGVCAQGAIDDLYPRAARVTIIVDATRICVKGAGDDLDPRSAATAAVVENAEG